MIDKEFLRRAIKAGDFDTEVCEALLKLVDGSPESVSVNKRAKKQIDDIVFVVTRYFDDEKGQALRKYIDHLEHIIAEFQRVTGQDHPTLTKDVF